MQFVVNQDKSMITLQPSLILFSFVALELLPSDSFTPINRMVLFIAVVHCGGSL